MLGETIDDYAKERLARMLLLGAVRRNPGASQRAVLRACWNYGVGGPDLLAVLRALIAEGKVVCRRRKRQHYHYLPEAAPPIVRTRPPQNFFEKAERFFLNGHA